MTYEEKVRWLRRYQESLRREQELAEEVERLRSEATRITPLLSGMPGGPGDGQKVPRAVERIAETQRRLEKQICECIKIRIEVIDCVERASTIKEKELLRRRYILGQSFEEISDKMHLEYRWVRRIHKYCVDVIKIKE